MTNDRFRDAIEIDFKDMDIQTKEELETLMRIAGYRSKFDEIENRKKKLNPSQIQLDFAWEYLKEIQE